MIFGFINDTDIFIRFYFFAENFWVILCGKRSMRFIIISLVE